MSLYYIAEDCPEITAFWQEEGNQHFLTNSISFTDMYVRLFAQSPATELAQIIGDGHGEIEIHASMKKELNVI
jgi:hypothetical protein